MRVYNTLFVELYCLEEHHQELTPTIKRLERNIVRGVSMSKLKKIKKEVLKEDQDKEDYDILYELSEKLGEGKVDGPLDLIMKGLENYAKECLKEYQHGGEICMYWFNKVMESNDLIKEIKKIMRE